MRHKEIIDRYDPELPLEQASTIPSSWYLNAELADLERHTVFARSWQFAGREEQVRNPGQYITCDIASQPIIVVRGQDNVLRAFFNVCLHHAAAVMSDPAGEASPLRCPYHGWTYTLDGHLKTTPDLGATCHFDRAAMTLKPVEVLIWKEWVFVRIERAGPPIPELSELTVAGFHWFERRHYLVDCNWKVFIDNYLDGGYHVPHIHKRLNSSLDYSAYQIELGERYCLQWSPYRGGERALYYWIYPNFMINRYPEAMDTNFVVPHGVSQTEVIFDFYFTSISENDRKCNFASIAASEAIQDEDAAICKSVQRGLASSAYTAGRLSVRREAGEHLFHRLLHTDLNSVSE